SPSTSIGASLPAVRSSRSVSPSITSTETVTGGPPAWRRGRSSCSPASLRRGRLQLLRFLGESLPDELPGTVAGGPGEGHAPCRRGMPDVDREQARSPPGGLGRRDTPPLQCNRG